MRGARRQIAAAVLAAALVGLAAAPATAQTRQTSEAREEDSFLRFLPETVRLEFDELIVRLDDEERLVVEYTIEPDSWSELRDHEIRVWLEMWIPLRIVYRFSPYPRLRDVRLLNQRKGTFQFPFWVDIDDHNAVGLCPLARTVAGDPKEFVAWGCTRPTDIRPRSSWGPELSTGEDFRLRRVAAPLGLDQWYWITPYGWLAFRRPLPQILPPQLPRRAPREGLSFPPGRRP